MNHSAITALSPLDGRYANKLTPLRALMSEQGYMHRRVQVEVAWLVALSEAGWAEFQPLSAAARSHLRALVTNFGTNDAAAIKEIEKTTNHDVKAVEYWIKAQCQRPDLSDAVRQELAPVLEFIHFACTSEDINNTSHALQLQAARAQVVLPALQRVLGQLRGMASVHAQVPMLPLGWA